MKLPISSLMSRDVVTVSLEDTVAEELGRRIDAEPRVLTLPGGMLQALGELAREPAMLLAVRLHARLEAHATGVAIGRAVARPITVAGARPQVRRGVRDRLERGERVGVGVTPEQPRLRGIGDQDPLHEVRSFAAGH